MSALCELSSGLMTGYDLSSVRLAMFGGSSPRKGEVKQLLEKLPTLQRIIQCIYSYNLYNNF